MITEDDRRAIYVANMTSLSERYKGFEIGRWFLLGEDSTARCKSMRSSLNSKLREPGTPGAKNATYADALVTQLLTLLDSKGFALDGMGFNSNGFLMSIPRKRRGAKDTDLRGGRRSEYDLPACPGVSSEQRTSVYVQTVTELREVIGTKEVIRIFLLGQTEQGAKDSMRAAVYAKLRSPEAKSHKGASYPETLGVQLLKFMHDSGYNLASLVFDDKGSVVRKELKKTVID